MEKVTLKVWDTEKDYDEGNARNISESLDYDDGLQLIMALTLSSVVHYYAFELYYTESGETIRLSEE